MGPIRFTHTLFRSRKDGTCHYLLDEWMELDAHERLSSRAEAEVLAEAVKTSYASAARVLGEDSLISKTAIMDKVHGIQTELPFPKPEKKSVWDTFMSRQTRITSTSRKKRNREEGQHDREAVVSV